MNFMSTYDELTTLWECRQAKLTESMLNLLADLGIDESEEPLTESKADELKLIDFAGEDLAARFLKIRARFKAPENDLYYWIKHKTPEDLEAAVSEIETAKTKSQVKKEAVGGAKLVGENEYWKVYHITTFEASQKYGRDTRWCITGINGWGDKYWKSYTKQGIEFYFYITKGEYDPRGTHSKMALALYKNGQYEIYNQQDYKEAKIKNAPKIDGLPYDIVVDEYIYEGGRVPFHIMPKKIIVADGVESIAPRAFQHKNGVTDIEIPNSVTRIEQYAFNGCSSLENITIPNSVTFIGTEAFWRCYSLKSIYIPKSVIQMRSYVFDQCEGLTVYFEANEPQDGWHEDWASGCNNIKIIWGYKK